MRGSGGDDNGVGGMRGGGDGGGDGGVGGGTPRTPFTPQGGDSFVSPRVSGGGGGTVSSFVRMNASFASESHSLRSFRSPAGAGEETPGGFGPFAGGFRLGGGAVQIECSLA